MRSFDHVLGKVFPLGRLPCATALDPRGSGLEGGQKMWLEEDLDLVGFLPLSSKRQSTSATSVSQEEGGGRGSKKVGKQVHPNVEQLIRIREILEMARIIKRKYKVSFCCFIVVVAGLGRRKS